MSHSLTFWIGEPGGGICMQSKHRRVFLHDRKEDRAGKEAWTGVRGGKQGDSERGKTPGSGRCLREEAQSRACPRGKAKFGVL